MAYSVVRKETPIVWLHGEVKTPPFSDSARREAGGLLGLFQQGQLIALPASRPMPSIGSHCHELRITDETAIWRIILAIDEDAIVILAVFKKKTSTTPKKTIDTCKRRLKKYVAALKD